MTLEFLTVFDGYEFKLLTFEKFDDFLFKVVSQAFKILNFNFYAAAFALFTFRGSQKPVQKMAPKFLTRGINKQKSFFHKIMTENICFLGGLALGSMRCRNVDQRPAFISCKYKYSGRYNRKSDQCCGPGE